MTDREHYRLMIMARTGCDVAAALFVLECAEDSFAAWPARRELTLRDVVHYLAVNELLDLHDGGHWTYTDIQRIVDARIPEDLDVARRQK